jgi:peroxiredoxin
MPLLQSVWTTLSAAKAPVVFMGVNLGDGAATGAAAARSFGLTYPSLSDPDRAMPSQLQGKANATPTTLVLDRQGRIAARFSGAITSAATLRDVITEVVAERA